MMLRNALQIPSQVDASDYVLQLHSGVDNAERTLDDYVVTDALGESFNDALGLIERTIADGTSKGAFVHGSFGSGKSHFLAVLHLLLTGNTRARALPGLQAAVAAHQDLLNRKILAIDYHLLGSQSFEAALFDGYRKTVAKLHPDAPTPVLHKSDTLLNNAQEMRDSFGDEKFFARLNSSGTSRWGDLDTGWDPASFDSAIASSHGQRNERERLVRTLIETIFTSYTQVGEWLDISTGLEVMTAHARSLGYDGIVLFLDELVLWLAQHLGNTEFIQTEASKVAKLVESGLGTLPLPLFSFVARQRDLKDFLGGDAIGAEREAIGHSFQWWEDRFDRITLAAADLPKIVNRRLLRPIDEAGQQAVERAITNVKADRSAWQHLLNDEAGSGEVDFALVYPFSPALVDALIALSSLMQRERTALKIMGELLAEGYDTLRINDVIPVGDLFDAVVTGAHPLSPDMKNHFQQAADFYHHRMRPYLLDKHDLTDAQTDQLPREHAFLTEDRLAKTLLVAELAPKAPSLRNITAEKLAALNFGTVGAFVPGQEAITVRNQVQDWAREFGEIHIAEGDNPVLSIRLSGVDYDSILERVANEDTESARRLLITKLLSQALQIPEPSGLQEERIHTMVWRGSKRDVDVIFGTIRDEKYLPADAFRAGNERWKLVVDYPFGEPTITRVDAINRVEQLRHDLHTQTVVWIPYFLSDKAQHDLGRLVILEHLMTGNRFEQNATALPLDSREPARRTLENQRQNLRDKMLQVLAQAYDVTSVEGGDDIEPIDGRPVFYSLDPGLRITAPVAPDLSSAIDHVLSQAYEYQFPQHPRFEPSDSKVRRNELNTVWRLAQRAATEGGRIEGLDRGSSETLHRIVTPLGCGQVRENVYTLGPDTFGWRQEFVQWASSEGEPDGGVQIRSLREQLAAYGMAHDVEDLLILCWSQVADRQWIRAGTKLPEPPEIGKVTEDMRLIEPRLPSEQEWKTASQRAGQLFGITADRVLSVRSVSRLAEHVRFAAETTCAHTRKLVNQLEEYGPTLGLDEHATDTRLTTARRAYELDSQMAETSDDTDLVKTLAAASIPAEPQSLAKARTTAEDVNAAMGGAHWDLFRRLRTDTSDEGEKIRIELAEAVNAEELHVQLGKAIERASKDAWTVLVDQSHPAPSDGDRPRNPAPKPSGSAPGKQHDEEPQNVDEIALTINQDQLDTTIESLRAFARKHPGRDIHLRWWVE